MRAALSIARCVDGGRVLPTVIRTIAAAFGILVVVGWIVNAVNA
jgi:hypothetical protein